MFALGTNGTGFTNLHTFTYDDGASLLGELTLSGNTLYGTTCRGGTFRNGTLFAIDTSGAGFTSLHSFRRVSDGATPDAGLALSGNNLYGTAAYGGSSGNGTVFSLSLPVPSMPPSMGILIASNQIVLTWPTNTTGFTLQSIANLSSGIWSNVLSGIAIVSTNNVFTNTMAGSASFFRLKQ